MINEVFLEHNHEYDSWRLEIGGCPRYLVSAYAIKFGGAQLVQTKPSPSG